MPPRFLCLLFTPCLLILAAETPAADDKPTAPLKVEVSQPLVREVTDYEDFTGRTAAVQSATLRARVSGPLEKILFKEGTLVKQGDLLFEIDPRPYKAELDKAEAEVVRQEAHRKRVAADLERAKRLLDTKAINREDLDKIQGEVAEAEASLRGARAAWEFARLHLEFTRVTAPVSGRIGRALLTAGNLVQADATDLATIVSVDPMYCYFDVDERTALRLRRLAQEGKFKEVGLRAQLGLLDEKGLPHVGQIDFVDNQVDPTRGTLRMRAVFPNSDHLLIPGLFARVRLVASTPYKALLVPQQALLSDQGHVYLFAVTDRNVAERRAVKVGGLHDGLRVVKEGLKEKDWVIVNGLKDVKEGAAVEPKRVNVPLPPSPEGAK